MGEIAGELADLVILTSENPRNEDPFAILNKSRKESAIRGANIP